MSTPRSVRAFVAPLLLLALPGFALPGHATAADWSLSGTVLTPEQIIADGAVSVSGATIAAVGPSSSLPMGSNPIKIPGVILPGFIDLHNHLTWNVLPRWTAAQKFANRYEWQNVPEYDRVLVAPHNAVMNAAACEVEIYAEIKALAGGATSSLGSLLPSPDHPNNRDCSASLVRNLDIWSELPFVPPKQGDPCEPAAFQPLPDVVDNEIFPMQVPHDRVDFLRCMLRSGKLPGLVIHLSEGAPNDASAHQEFLMLQGTDLLMPGLAIIHGTALRVQDFKVMRDKDAGLIWSPRSNDELYGGTENIAAAQQQNVAIAIAPDWSPTGSAGMLQEMTYASRRYTYFNAAQLIKMATSIPAKIARLDGYIGSLSPGRFADIVAIRAGAADVAANPAQAVLRASPADILLVVVNGQPLYGDPDLMKQLLPGRVLDAMTVCGTSKSVYLGQSAAVGLSKNLAKIEKDLDDALRRSGSQLASIECD
jgi:5-methylthioadenosine/S-adenosylhomocysteine deaminase